MFTFLVQYYFPGPRSYWSKKKEMKARDLLGSFASDTDLALDWWFLADVTLDENIDKVPDALRITHLVFTVMGTFTWFALASDGRAVDWFIIKPLLFLNCIWLTCFGKSGCRNQAKCLPTSVLWEDTRRDNPMKLIELEISTGFLLLCGILLEDIPQIVLSFLIKGWLEMDEETGDRGSLSGIAVANLLTSIYNALIKMADAYDQRQDVVVVTTERKDISKELSNVIASSIMTSSTRS